MIGLFLSLAPSGLGSEEFSELLEPARAVEKLQPNLRGDKAKRLARAFQRTSLHCGIDWRILVSIAYHESSLTLSKINVETHDYGLMQINSKNVLRFGLSRERLLKDPTYSIEFACKLLKDNKKRYASKYSYWVGIYRSGTALSRHAIRANAQSYDKMIRGTAKELGYEELEYAQAE